MDLHAATKDGLTAGHFACMAMAGGVYVMQCLLAHCPDEAARRRLLLAQSERSSSAVCVCMCLCCCSSLPIISVPPTYEPTHTDKRGHVRGHARTRPNTRHTIPNMTSGQTLLHKAALAGHADVVDFLLDPERLGVADLGLDLDAPAPGSAQLETKPKLQIPHTSEV